MPHDTGKEVEILKRALIPNDLDYTPEEIADSIGKMTNEQLWNGLVVAEDAKVKIQYQQGWALIILKKRLGHKNFQNALEERNLPYSKCNQMMNIARGCIRHPGLQQITSIRLLHRIFYLPERVQDRIETKIQVETGNGKKQWKELRGWIVEEIARQTVSKVRQLNAAANRKDATLEEAQIVEEHEQEDPIFRELRLSFHQKARAGINRFLADLKRFNTRPNVKANLTLFEEVGGTEQRDGWMRQLRLAVDDLIPEMEKLQDRLAPEGMNDD